MTAPDLFTDPLPTAEPLEHKQEIVLRAVIRLQGLSADEAGQVVHGDEGKHLADETCPWCGYEGAKVLRALEEKRLVCSRGGHWTFNESREVG
jgi:NADH pyrophosphatase NudC (nudix superfamily)